MINILFFYEGNDIYFIFYLYFSPIAGQLVQQVHGMNTRSAVPKDGVSVWR